MENMKEMASKAGEEVSKNIEQNASKWSDLIKELVDKLTGKDMAVTYEFKNLEIDMPRASGPGGKEIGSAKWKINGKFVISTELHDKPKTTE
jgi:protein subunit release factor B